MTTAPVAPAGDDLLAQDTLRESVRERYRAVIGTPTEVASQLYSPDEVGIDTLIAARAVAPGGKAIGLDTLPEMLELAGRNAAEAGIANIEWVRGELESIPMPDASVDVAISNGVVNLSPRKGRALAEAFRVLRPGGRVSLADIVVDEDLPPEVLVDPDAWAG